MSAGSTETPQLAWRGSPTGVLDRGASTLGLHRNLRDPRVSTRPNSGGIRVTNILAHAQMCTRRVGANNVRNGWNRCPKATTAPGAQGVRGPPQYDDAG